MSTALVLSAGGMYAAWEVGVWKALRERFQPDLVVGASAGAWNGWAIAGGSTPDELAAEWLDPSTAGIMQPRLHACGIVRPEALCAKARHLYERFRPRMPFALTVVEIPRLRARLVCDSEITWRHLAATAAIPGAFPPVRIDGKFYVDGGLMGGLPLWAAQKMGARRAIGLNVLTAVPFRVLRAILPPPKPGAGLETIVIEPSQPLGPLSHAVCWSEERIRGWIELGERDGNRAISSITM